MLAFIHDRTIVVSSVPSWAPIRYLRVGPATEIRWSPDSDQIAYVLPPVKCEWGVCRPVDGHGIWVADLEDGSTRQVSVGGEKPTWGPAGERIAHMVGPELRIVSSSGEDARLLHRFDDRGAAAIAWGPGSWIAASVSGRVTRVSSGPDHQVTLIPVRDTEITEDDFVSWGDRFHVGREIVWGPDGSALAIATGEGAMVTAGVGEPLVPVGTIDHARFLTWSPDGRWLAFDNDDLTVVADLHTGELHPLGEGGQPHWRPV